VADVIAAIRGGVDVYGCDVLNMSFALDSHIDSSELSELILAIDEAVEQGVVIVASAGNLPTGSTSTGSDRSCYPASCDGVIGVGAVDQNEAVAWFSYQNDSVLLVAPGESMSLPSVKTGGWELASGTSFSAPIVAAAAALMLSARPELSSAELMTLLQGTAQDLGPEGWDSAYGYGLLSISGLLDTLQGQWVYLDVDGEASLFTWLKDVTPGDTVTAVIATYGAEGRQNDVSLVSVTAADNGGYTEVRLSLKADAPQVRVFLLDQQSFTPLCVSYERNTAEIKRGP
jgi:subtilisin family serine protease